MKRSVDLPRAADAVIRWALDHPKTILMVIAVVTALALIAIPRLQVDVDFSNYLNANDPAVIAAHEAHDRFGSQIRLIVAIEDPQGVFRPETLTLTQRLESALNELPVVESTVSPLSAQVIRGSETAIEIRSAAPDGKAPQTPEEIETFRDLVSSDDTLRDYVVSAGGTAFAIYVKPEPGVELVPFAEAVETVVQQYETDGITLSLAGIPYVNLTLEQSMRHDLRLFLPLVILIIIGVLSASFRWLWGVVIPFAVVSISVLWTVGLMAAFGVPITVLSFILPVLLMAIGIADGIHVLSRYREELSRRSDKREAILETMKAMKRPVVLTSLTTAVGFLSLLNAYMVPQRTFGLFTSVGILIAMVLSLLLIPASLRLVRPPSPTRVSGHRRLSHVLGALVRRVIRHRVAVLIGAIVVAGAFAAMIPQLQIETSERAFLGEGQAAVVSMDRLGELFSGSDQVMIEVNTGRRDGLKDPAILRKMVDLETFLKTKGVTKTLSLTHIVREMNQRFHADDPAFHVIPEDRPTISQLLLLFSFQGGSLGSLSLADFSAGEIMGFHALKTGEEQIALVRDVTDYLQTHFTGDVTARMAGPTRIQASMFSAITRSQILSLVTSILAAGVIVIVLMRSWSAGIVSMTPLLLTVLVNFGVMVLAGKKLDIATLMISSITVGIGIDYGIHFIERYREERGRTKLRSDALVRAAETTGTGIFYNALALALGFGVMLLSSFQGLQNFGALIMMTMVISAVTAFAVIPALLGKRESG